MLKAQADLGPLVRGFLEGEGFSILEDQRDLVVARRPGPALEDDLRLEDRHDGPTRRPLRQRALPAAGVRGRSRAAHRGPARHPRALRGTARPGGLPRALQPLRLGRGDDAFAARRARHRGARRRRTGVERSARPVGALGAGRAVFRALRRRHAARLERGRQRRAVRDLARGVAGGRAHRRPSRPRHGRGARRPVPRLRVRVQPGPGRRDRAAQRGRRRPALRARAHPLCEEFLARFPGVGPLVVETMRRAIADAHFQAGEAAAGERLYREWLEADPSWGWGWIGW